MPNNRKRENNDRRLKIVQAIVLKRNRAKDFKASIEEKVFGKTQNANKTITLDRS